MQLADILLAGVRVGKRNVSVDLVLVAATVSLAGDVAGGGQLSDDAMGGPFGDPDLVADLAQANAGIVGDADQHPGVVGQKRPTGSWMLSQLE